MTAISRMFAKGSVMFVSHIEGAFSSLSKRNFVLRGHISSLEASFIQ